MQAQEFGAVFTQRWMVDLILDLAGYTFDRDLAELVAHEPACGDGAFLLPMVERLVKSCHRHGRKIGDAGAAIRAWDLQAEHVQQSRAAVEQLLIARACGPKEAGRLAKAWVSRGDYLLDGSPPRSADFVLGNPPYIRAEAIPRDVRERYLAACEAMTPGADIFVGFFEKGLAALREGGALCFICADRWMHNTYGRRLRQLVATGYAVEAVLKMHGVDAFASEVSAYPAVTLVRRATQGTVRYAESADSFDASAAKRLAGWARTGTNGCEDPHFTAAHLPSWFPGDDLWPTGSPARLKLLERLEKTLPPLEDAATGTRVGIGVATGADRVFITHDPDAAEPDRMLPLLLTEHTTGGTVAWSNTWLLNPWNADGGLVSLSRWPRFRKCLERHRAALAERHIAKRSVDDWYRTIDKVHAGLAATPKLLFQDMKRSICPILDEGGYYPHHNLYWLTSQGWDLRVLGGLLLSRVAQLFVEAYAVRMRGGTLRFQAQYLRRIRVPRPRDICPELQKRLAAAFDERDEPAATRAALAAYGLKTIPA